MKFRLIAITLTLAAAGLHINARHIKTGPTQIKRAATAESHADTIYLAEADSIRCAGYEKPNSALRETMFITNHMADSLAIDAINISLDYRTLDGRQLHCATHTVTVNLPHGATRNISIPSWDRNNAFHYYRSPAPRRRASTPYTVTARVNYVMRK